MKPFQRISFVLFLSILSFQQEGCVSAAANKQYKYEYTSPEQEALLAVQGAPLKFLIPFGDDHYAWERVGIFFKEMIREGMPVVNTNTASGELLADGKSKSFAYSIRKIPTNDGYGYIVSCVKRDTGATTGESELNARNLARFIREGKLERQVLIN